MAKTSIEWTDETWNPLTGCTKISAGCTNCYAEVMAKRLLAMKNRRYLNGFEPTLHEDLLLKPYRWKKPRKVFVNSMSDLFHKDFPFEFLQKTFKTMNDCSQHQFQVLTKRAEILEFYSHDLVWTKNIWMGVTVESAHYKSRIDLLRDTPAHVKFLSLEPLLGPIDDLNLTGIDWVIVGGESGPKSRPVHINWIRDIRDQCTAAKVPFFFKQWGGKNKKKSGRILDGRTWDEFPPIYHFEADKE